MDIKRAFVRTALGTAVIAAAVVTTAGVAGADVPSQPADQISQQNSDIAGFGSGSAAGSGHALGDMIGRLLFHNDN
ncbi:hypothetical protein D7D52_34615 [Nocardia yunnanensis]|uniref:DUF2613 family protein n=1 Tax=Nocardia yunnanensis TaxID=2382165 RepID=A0A386ZLE7_9NOCA|nr:hypothetical protein [Nocardia yunnanensis]AYF78110.1 hypothetical protein D7D52_34615 [Nocardia yunnanensis]